MYNPCIIDQDIFLMSILYMQGSWTNASKKQREKLLELIRRLAEDDKEGVMAHKVRCLLCCLIKTNI